MKAIVYDRYGSPDTLELRDVEVPPVTSRTLLIRVRAASVNPYDWHFLTGLPWVGRLQFGLFGPKLGRLGADLAGGHKGLWEETGR